MKRVEIFNDNYNALGFGDTLNKLSYLYRIYENTDVEFIFHDKRKIFENIIFLKNFCLEEPKYKKTFIDSPHFLRTDDDFRLINHDYYPTRVKWNKKSDFLAINFYTNIKKLHKFEFNYETNYQIEQCKCFYDGDKIVDRYKTVELFTTDVERGIKKLDSNPLSGLEKNMKILSECSLFVTSEGGMAHLSRAMKVPTIIYFKKSDNYFCEFLNTFIDKKIQKLVHTTDEMIYWIDYYFKYDKFS